MTIFRKNYLPKMVLCQTHDGKWIAHNGSSDALYNRVFVQRDDGSYDISAFNEWTRFDTLDDLITAIYEYACKTHLTDIKSQLTYGNIKAKL